MRKLRSRLAAAMLIVAGLACGQLGVPAGPTATPRLAIPTPTTRASTPAQPTQPTQPTQTVTASPTPPEHRIGIRLTGLRGEFYDRLTGAVFVPRGNNYIRLALEQDSGQDVFAHSTFDTGFYDPERIEAALAAMQTLGYNTVRVFLNHCCAGGIGSDDGLSAGYLDNLTDFLRRAEAHGIFAIPTFQWLPAGKYGDLIGQSCCDLFTSANVLTLADGGVRAHEAFFQDLIRGLQERRAPVGAILAYSLRNELYFDSNEPPLSLGAGLVSAANGQSYDMALPDDQARLMDDNLVHFIDEVRAAIREVDPTALVTVGFFVPQAPHPVRLGDARIIQTRAAIWESTMDFIDLHLYPGGELSLAQHVDNFKMAGMETKPILMGEFGAGTNGFIDDAAAARALEAWQVDSCQPGFDGWLLWTWDSTEQPEFYNALSGEGQIASALAPAYRPDPCARGEATDFNLAGAGVAQASHWLPDQLPQQAFDGLSDTIWGAGDMPPQWIEIDLGKPMVVAEVHLQVAQTPEGETYHRLLGRAASETTFRLLAEFQGTTRDQDWLTEAPSEPWTNIQVIRVETVSSPSWVAWREIEILGRAAE